jgi:hypothetical protein
MVGPVELAFRVVTTLFVVVAPTLLFLGLWRGLQAMRDDELIEQMRATGVMDDPQGDSAPVFVDGLSGEVDGLSGGVEREGETIVCDACGTANVTGVTFCWNCLQDLPD